MRSKFLHAFSLLLILGLIGIAISTYPDEFSISPQIGPAPASGDLAVLILGRAGAGEGGRWEQAPDLTDTILLADFHPGSGTLNLISIPRDLYGDWGAGTFKINEAYERNDLTGLLKSVGNLTGIPVANFLVVDLNTVSDAISAMGGLDLNLPAPVTDSVSGFTLPAGETHLTGAEALWLVRNRYSSEGDFFRESNQQLVIGAAVGKFESLSLAQKTSILFRVLPVLAKDQTNLGLGEILPELDHLRGLKINDIVMNFQSDLWESSSTPAGTGSEYILIPSAGIGNYAAVRTYIQSRLR